METYITLHPEQKEFVSILKKAAETKNNVNIVINAGKKIDNDTFLCYLQSMVENPRILFTSGNKENCGIPSVMVSTRNDTVALFCLSDMDNLEICKEHTDVFNRYDISFSINDIKIDYNIKIIIEKINNYLFYIYRS